MDSDLKVRVKKARRSFMAIVTSYFMGLFNDNFYKEAALLIAVMQGNTSVQALAAGCFTVSYMLGAAPGGWMADRFSKGNIIIWAKAVEVVAMIIGAIGIWTGNWPMIIGMISLMGAQSAIFSPSMNGSIPEIYPDEYVQPANTNVRIVSTSAIFLGMALAGCLIDITEPACRGIPKGIFLVGVFVLIASVAGFLVAFAAPRISAKDPSARFPYTGPIESIVEILKLKRDRLLALCVGGNLFLWSLAAVLTLLIVNLGLVQFGLSARVTAGIKILFLIGIATGGVLSNFIAKGRAFFRVFVPTIYVMAVMLVLVGIVPYILSGRAACLTVAILLVLTGIAGGVDLIPLESFIQIRPAPGEKGRVIAASNFAAFAGMTVGAGALYLLNKYCTPTTSFAILGVVAGLYGWWISKRIKEASGAEYD